MLFQSVPVRTAFYSFSYHLTELSKSWISLLRKKKNCRSTSIERAQSEIALKVTKIHLWQGSMKITFYCFAHRPFDIMRAQTRLQANYERNSSETQISAEKVSSREQNSSLVEFPLGVWSFRCNFHVRSIKCFQLGKTDHDFIPVPRTAMKFERLMFNTFASP